jgi:HTH-type transcriptional regulator/antitoxin HigA
MIATYEKLLAEMLPSRIETEREYDAIRERFGSLMLNRHRSAAEKKLMALLGVLIEDYDRRNAMPPDDSTPAERLRFLLEHSGKTPADLAPVFGQRSHVNEALTGKRAISVAQARKLAAMFHVTAGLFV